MLSVPHFCRMLWPGTKSGSACHFTHFALQAAAAIVGLSSQQRLGDSRRITSAALQSALRPRLPAAAAELSQPRRRSSASRPAAAAAGGSAGPSRPLACRTAAVAKPARTAICSRRTTRASRSAAAAAAAVTPEMEDVGEECCPPDAKRQKAQQNTGSGSKAEMELHGDGTDPQLQNRGVPVLGVRQHLDAADEQKGPSPGTWGGRRSPSAPPAELGASRDEGMGALPFPMARFDSLAGSRSAATAQMPKKRLTLSKLILANLLGLPKGERPGLPMHAVLRVSVNGVVQHEQEVREEAC